MKKYFWLIAILVLAAALRFYHNTDISLWHDEAFSALMIRYGWGEMFTRLALDVHPPLYYIFLKFWHVIFGDKLLSLRGFSIFFGVLTVWATWLFTKYSLTPNHSATASGTGRENEKMALWAALLVAISTFQLQYVTEARMYTMGAFFSVLAAYFLVRALREQREFYDDGIIHPIRDTAEHLKDHLSTTHPVEFIKAGAPHIPPAAKGWISSAKGKRGWMWHYLLFAVCAGIIDMTHYYLLFTTAALCFYALIYHIYHYRFNYKRYAELLLSFIVIAIFFLPWLKQFIFQYKQVSAGYWIPPMNIWSIPGTLWTMLLGIGHDNSNSATLRMLVVVFFFSLFFFWCFLRKTQYFEKWLVLLATLAPFGGAILFVLLARLKGSNSSVYEERYFLFSSAFFIIAISVWVYQIKPKWFSVSLFIIYTLFNLYSFSNYWHGLNVATKPGMNGAAKYLGSNVAANNYVFVGSSFEFFNYKYYDYTYYPLPKGVQPLLFTNGTADVTKISHVAGVALLANRDLLPSFSDAVHTGDTVWLLWTDAFGSDSNGPQVPLNWTSVDKRGFPDVRPWVGTNIYVAEYKVN